MTHYQLPLGIAIALMGPVITLRYLKSIVMRVIDLLCAAPGSSEFWWRIVTVLAVTGSLLLTLWLDFGNDDAGILDFLRRSLLLTTLSIFVSVSIVASRIWKEIAAYVHRRSFEPPAARPLGDALET
jgi:hypothetical protein